MPATRGYAYIPTLATMAVVPSGLIANPKGNLPTAIEAVISFFSRSVFYSKVKSAIYRFLLK